MKRLALTLALLAWPAAADAHDGFVDIKNYSFNPATITVTEGVLVLWRWDGPDLNHTVTGDGFESDPGKEPLEVNHKAGDSYPVIFDRAGTYAYHCRVHASMSGTVIVEPAPRTDSRRPRLSRVRAKVKGRRAIVGFRASESVSLTTQVRRPGRKKVLRESFDFFSAGNRRTAIRLPGRGRFAVRLRAQDDSGNDSKPVTVTVRR